MPRQFGKVDISASWPTCPNCPYKHETGIACPPVGIWLARRTPSAVTTGVFWIKRPMPNGQWPADKLLPRDDSFSWWVRSNCGHERGARQWAFYREADADLYERIFMEDPCRWAMKAHDRKRR